MYVDLIVLIVLLVFVIIYSKRFQTYIFGFGMIDVLFRILNAIVGYIPVKDIRKFIEAYVPSSVPAVINKYADGLLRMGLVFLYAIVMAIFLYYVVKIFIKRKKI